MNEDRLEKMFYDMLQVMRDGFADVKAELKGVRVEIEQLKLYQERTNRILTDLSRDVEEIKDKIDFDVVHFDNPVVMETDPVTGSVFIRRIRPAS